MKQLQMLLKTSKKTKNLVNVVINNIFNFDDIEYKKPKGNNRNIDSFIDSFYDNNNTYSSFYGTVTRIIDGDTIEVDYKRIRLSMIDTPERGKVGFESATRYMESICPVGSFVYVSVDDSQTNDVYGRSRDKYNRILGVIYHDDMNVNYKMFESGHAKPYLYFVEQSKFNGDRWIEQMINSYAS